MPASEDDTEPRIPAGYAPPYLVGYPTLVLLLGSFALGLVAAGGYGLLVWFVQGPQLFETFVEVTQQNGVTVATGDISTVVGPFVVAILVTVVIHELLHGLAFKLYGYDVEYGIIPAKGVFYTAAVGQYQMRSDLFPVALAPLIVITVVAIPALFVPIPTVAITAYFILILNTSGAIGDLFITWQLWRMPPDTLLYDCDLQCMYAFEPAD